MDGSFGKADSLKGPIGTFASEQYQGSFASEFRKFFEKKYPKVPFKDATKFFEECLLVKDKHDYNSLRYAAKFTKYVMDLAIGEVEDDLDKNTGERHDVIGKRIDGVFDKKAKMEQFAAKLP